MMPLVLGFVVLVTYLAFFFDPYTIHEDCIPPYTEEKILLSIKPYNPKGSWFGRSRVALAGIVPAEVTLKNLGQRDFKQVAIKVLPVSNNTLAPFIETTVLLSSPLKAGKDSRAYTIDIPIDPTDPSPLPKYITLEVRLRPHRSRPVCFLFPQATKDFDPKRCDDLSKDVKVTAAITASALTVTLQNTGLSTFTEGHLSFNEEHAFYRPTTAPFARLGPFSSSTFRLERQRRDGTNMMELQDVYEYELRVRELEQEYPRCKKLQTRENATTWATEHRVLSSLKAKAEGIKAAKKGMIPSLMVLGYVGMGKSFFIQSVYTLFSTNATPSRFDVMTCRKDDSCTRNITRHVIKSPAGRELFVLTDTWGMDSMHDLTKELPFLLNGSMPDGWHYDSQNSRLSLSGPGGHAGAHARRIDAVLVFVSSVAVTSSGPDEPPQLDVLRRLLRLIEDANVMPLVIVTHLASVWPMEHASDPSAAPPQEVNALTDAASSRLGVDAHHVYLMPTYKPEDLAVRSIAKEKMTYAIIDAALGACTRRVKADALTASSLPGALKWLCVYLIDLASLVIGGVIAALLVYVSIFHGPSSFEVVNLDWMRSVLRAIGAKVSAAPAHVPGDGAIKIAALDKGIPRIDEQDTGTGRVDMGGNDDGAVDKTTPDQPSLNRRKGITHIYA